MHAKAPILQPPDPCRRPGIVRETRTLDDDRNLLTVAQAASVLERSTEQVRRYLRENRLTGQRLGGQWFIDRADLQQFAEATKVKQTFLKRVGPARTLRPLDSVIGIASGTGSDISRGKRAFLRRAAEQAPR
jgi:excisionase family DNA binding protein